MVLTGERSGAKTLQLTVMTPETTGEALADSTWDATGSEPGHVSVRLTNLSGSEGTFVVRVVGSGGATGQPDDGQPGSVTLAPGATTHLGFFVGAGTWTIELDGERQGTFQINQQ